MDDSGEKTFVVEGMTCGHCGLSVREEVEELPGVEFAHADRNTGRRVLEPAVRRGGDGAVQRLRRE